MENEKKDLKTGVESNSAENVTPDVTSKIADAAAEVQDEINAAEVEVEVECVEETNETPLLDDNGEVVLDEDGMPIYVPLENSFVEPPKEVKKVTMAMPKFVISLIASAVLGAFIFFVCMSVPSYIKNLPEGNAIAKVDGVTITDLDMNYYIFVAASRKFSEMTANEPNADMSKFDWEQKTEDGRALSDVIREDALKEAKSTVLTIKKGETEETKWTEDDQKQIDTAVDGFVTQYGEDGFLKRAKSMGINTIKEYKKTYESMTRMSTVKAAMEEDITKFMPEGVDMAKYLQKDRGSVQHILLKSAATANSVADPAATPAPSADPKTTAQTVADRAKGGEDFATLMKEFNQDSGATEKGYTFQKGEMVPEFEDAAFKLGLNEISGPVESSFGFHVIKRIAGMYELQAYWEETAKVSVNEKKLAKMSVKDIMTLAEDMNKEVASEEASKQSSKGGSASQGGSYSSDEQAAAQQAAAQQAAAQAAAQQAAPAQ
ncbi:MAG: peptidylprolyl isomerase [Oscillospiraceae bacterium]